MLATGFFDCPNPLGAEGEDLPHVFKFYREPYRWSGRDVVVVGAKNSAAKAALELNRHGARVRLVMRAAEVSPSVKYWIRPDLLNRIRDGAITAHVSTTVEQIVAETVRLRTPEGPLDVPADAVFALVGYRPDFDLLAAFGVETEGEARVPLVDPETMESTRAGVYLAGTVCGGLNTSRWFIENGRIHAAQIAAHLAGQPVPPLVAQGQP